MILFCDNNAAIKVYLLLNLGTLAIETTFKCGSRYGVCALPFVKIVFCLKFNDTVLKK